MTAPHPIKDNETAAQLEALGYLERPPQAKYKRPLLVCDVDEVVLHLVAPFLVILEETGFQLKRKTFKLTGNVFHKETGREATQGEIYARLDTIFSEQDRRQELVPGVMDALNDLSNDIDIVFLTNMPHDYRLLRLQHLTNQSLDHPVVTNTGSKVAAIHRMMAHHHGPIGFIDDTALNLSQVANALPQVHLFHFMADDGFRQLSDPVPTAKISTGDWQEAKASIREHLVNID